MSDAPLDPARPPVAPQAGATGGVRDNPTAPADATERAETQWLREAAAGEVLERPATIIGRYKLLNEIGVGGFGVIWRAEQTEPIRREVALKVIKPGMDSREIIARFSAERQALAMMDHPNIAGVLDAGTTENGRPYFVMELVKGVPITQYCDAQKLSIRERVELFVTVCQAVQHAHQKGILHRDLKPSNILVAEVDEKAVPKVIDFGIAKALGVSAEEMVRVSTLQTNEGAVIGTPQYMSPEQAGARPDLDTRSDIYTLSVILYELLTGDTPLARASLHQAVLAEVLRLIREGETPKPSSRVVPVTESVRQTSLNRRIDPAKLAPTLRGDLDWIILKGLEKDRERRYPSAADLAQDLDRHLRDEPVEAGPPSAGYRLRKFVRRHRGPMLAGAAVVVALLAGVIGTTWGMLRASRHAKAEAVLQALVKDYEEKFAQIEQMRMVAGAAATADLAPNPADVEKEQRLLAEAVALAQDIDRKSKELANLSAAPASASPAPVAEAAKPPPAPVASTGRTDTPYTSTSEFAKYAMKLRQSALLKMEPQVVVPTTIRMLGIAGKYPWKTQIVTTTFSVGREANVASAWDTEWIKSYGGFDDPNPAQRRNFIPTKFVPKQNPFYIALPYNDVYRGTTKPEAKVVIPWFKLDFEREGKSVCRDRWIAVRSRAGKVCYGQWSDCGPARSDHWQYVFGNEKPKTNAQMGAGLSMSPAIRDYLQLQNTDVTDWKFVDFKDVPRGPWSLYGENNPFVHIKNPDKGPEIISR